MQHINTFADSNLSTAEQRLHKGPGTEDVTSDRAGGGGQPFSRSGGANGGRGRRGGSFVLERESVISPMALSAPRASIARLTSVH